MQILELHLRNIASIIEADIDFTKDLKDGVTGDPASLFLICGDTGAGKSVILDGIAMALYKSTPRLKGVNGRTNNTFTNLDGNNINLTDISQYTRLGISHKDNCFSEVVFKGNDGVIYKAKLSLGYQKNRKLKPAKWKVMQGDNDWVSRDNECEQLICEAIGLSFDQFCRMVMLAQGQFAAFLTGKKDNRTVILEQLTNTERFSTYGTAVHNIYKKAEDERKVRQTQFDTEAGHLLSEEELQEVQDDKEVFLKQRQFAEQRSEKAANQLNTLQHLIGNVRQLKLVQTKIQELETKQQQDDYLADLALIEAWDKTIDVRLRLKDLKKARKEKENEEKKSAGQARLFTILSADILHRRNTLLVLIESLKSQQEWLDNQNPRLLLYEQAGAVKEQLRQYETLLNEIKEKVAKLTEEQGKTERLKKQAEMAKAEYERASKAMKDKELEIETQKRALDAYNLGQINKDIKTHNKEQQSLKSLKEAIERLQKELSELKELEAEIRKDREQLTTLELDKKTKAEAYSSASESYDQINGQLNTRLSCVNDMIKTLRAKIVSEGIDTCPLCGQHIATKIDETDFEQTLAPWREKEKTARTERDEAQKASQIADKAYNDLSGILKEKTEGKHGYSKRLSLAETTSEMLRKRAEDNGLTFDGTISTQIDCLINNTEMTINQLTEQQKAATAMQDAYRQLNEEKKPIDKALANADKALIKCQQNVKDNQNAIDSLQTLIGETQTKKAKTEETLAAVLNEFYPQWKEQPVNTRNTLYNDSELYKEKKKKFEKDINNRQHLDTLLKQIEDIQSELATRHTGWIKEGEAKAYNCEEILSEWQRLATAVAETDAKLIEYQSAMDGFAAVIAESGRSEEELERIQADEKRYEPAKLKVKKTNEDLTRQKGSRTTLYQQIQAGEEKLGLEHADRIGDNNGDALYDELLTSFETAKTNADRELNEILTKLTEINNRLAANESNRNQLEEFRHQLEDATKRQNHWKLLDDIFGGSKFRTLVQTFILRPLLGIANQYLERITDRYLLTCDEHNEQLSILVLDRYNKNQVRSATVLSGGETFMISLALSLALSSLNSKGMNVNILFIDEGFGTLDEKSLDSVMSTLEKLQEIAGQSHRRVGIISHREELLERIPVKIKVEKKGEGRSQVSIENTL